MIVPTVLPAERPAGDDAPAQHTASFVPLPAQHTASFVPLPAQPTASFVRLPAKHTASFVRLPAQHTPAAESTAQPVSRNTGRIIGSVRDGSTAEPVPGVQVFVEGTSLGTVTDADGRFELGAVPTGNRTIIARFVGYRTERHSIVVENGAVVTVDIRLHVEALRLEDVIVTATGERQDRSRLAASIGSLDHTAIDRARPAHPSEILSRISGVWVSATSGEGHMTAIRQPLTTDAVYLYLENGVPIRSTGFFNHNALYEVNVPMAQRVEVMKGPGTALYGSDAIGAVINVATRQPTDNPSARLSVEGGAFGFGRMMLGTGATYGRHGVRLDLNGTKSAGWRNASRYDRQSGTLTWEIALPGVSRLRTVFSFSHVDQEPAGASAVDEEDFRMDPTRNYTPISFRNVTAVRISSAYERFTPRAVIALTPYARFNDMRILPNWSLTYDPSVYTTRNLSAGLLARYRRDVAAMDARFISGIDVEYSPGEHVEQSIDPAREGKVFASYTGVASIYDYGVDFYQASPYVHLEAEPLRDLRLTGGLRLDVLAYDYDNRLGVLPSGRHRRAAGTTKRYAHASPKLGATYRIAPTASVFASYAHAFRVPSEAQLFRQGSTNNTLELEPVRADNFEVGLRGRFARPIQVELSVYRMIKRDDIVSVTNAEGLQIVTNAGRTSHRGVELGFTLSAGAGVELQIAHSYAVHRFEAWQTSSADERDFSGREMDSAPRNMTNAILAYAPPFLPGSTVSLEWTRLGAYWMDPANTVKYDGHRLINVRASADLPAGLTAFARLTNTTDERYAERASFNLFRGREYAPGLPRALYLGLEYQLRADR